MVKVYGPMMSLQASGTLGDVITFGHWKGRPYVRERVIPSNPKSGAQTGRRAMMKFLSQNWAALTAGQKASWQDIADQLVASPFNAYVSSNMKEWHNFIPPTQLYPATVGGTPATTPIASSATWEENRINNEIDLVTAADNWGIALYASTTTGFTPAVGNCYQVWLFETPATFNFYWTPPSVATWFFRNQVFADDSVFGTLEAEYSAVP